MKAVVITNEALKAELLAQNESAAKDLVWQSAPAPVVGADYYVDLLFEPSPARIRQLNGLAPATIIVNAVATPLQELPGHFIRINGWPTFLKREWVEAVANDPQAKKQATGFFDVIGKKPAWVPDQPGLVAARVVCMLINEAYFALEEQVSTKEEINTAMKLGTNYPYGPFEWAEQVGLEKICGLLEKMSLTDPRYAPAPWLKKEASA